MDLIEKLLIFLAGVLGSVLANELKDWTPWIVQRLIKCSVTRLPEDRQERFEEEWASHVDEVPGAAAKILVAAGFLWAAIRISWILGIRFERDLFAGRINRAPLTEAPALVEGILIKGIRCKEKVALPVHRLLAAAADGSIISIAVGLFLITFYLSGGEIAFTKKSSLLLSSLVAAVLFLYRLLWCLGNGDTPGMRFAGLRLVNFDGQPPDRDQRMFRMAASVLSVGSAGLGLMWALVDEECLTWHDYISGTFPTPT